MTFVSDHKLLLLREVVFVVFLQLVCEVCLLLLLVVLSAFKAFILLLCFQLRDFGDV
jgi:hypothetical protein